MDVDEGFGDASDIVNIRGPRTSFVPTHAVQTKHCGPKKMEIGLHLVDYETYHVFGVIYL